MMTREQQIIEERKTAEEFIGKLGSMVNYYKHAGISVGVLLGALETVKLRIFFETNERVTKELEKEEGPKS